MIQQFHFCVFIQKKKKENTNLERYMHPYTHCSFIYKKPRHGGNLNVYQ